MSGQRDVNGVEDIVTYMAETRTVRVVLMHLRTSNTRR